jgi:hypothetical protein
MEHIDFYSHYHEYLDKLRVVDEYTKEVIVGAAILGD